MLSPLATTVVAFAITWPLAAVAAHALHLLGGCLAVGPSEVRQQVAEAYRELGLFCYALFVLTAGILPREKPEVSD